MQISRLKSLQCLTNFIVGNQTGSAISELRELRNLRGKLFISNFQNVLDASDASEATMNNKEYLEELWLTWGAEHTDDSQKEREVLEKLHSITNYGGTKFPDWLGDRSFVNLKFLWLYCFTYCYEMPLLQNATSLQSLWIWDCPNLVYGHARS